MRARLALVVSGVEVELREVLLRDKPQAFLEASASATVPCLVASDRVIDESLDIMIWALDQHDPEGWLDIPKTGFEWVARADGPFKAALDRTKYATRYPECDPAKERDNASVFLSDLNNQLGEWIFATPSLADYAILPFVRQFAFIDKPWFDARDWPDLHRWLQRFLSSDRFSSVMSKYETWHVGDPEVWFPHRESGHSQKD